MDDEGEGRRCVATADELAANGRYEDAIAWYQQAIARAPVACAGYRFVVGELLFELQRYDEAARTFEVVVGALPDHPPAWEALGRTLSMLGRAERAADALERAIALDPSWGEPLYHAALAYTELGRRELAEDRLRRAMAIDERFGEAAKDDGLV
ncbi:MAG: tetratricopeptide repeat protein [Myxococcota bacterium]|nr:tetratricopeptide repeat protein [Myxococcota bacterium]